MLAVVGDQVSIGTRRMKSEKTCSYFQSKNKEIPKWCFKGQSVLRIYFLCASVLPLPPTSSAGFERRLMAFACEFSVSLGNWWEERLRVVQRGILFMKSSCLGEDVLEEFLPFLVDFFFPWIWSQKQSTFEDVQNQWLRGLAMERYNYSSVIKKQFRRLFCCAQWQICVMILK